MILLESKCTRRIGAVLGAGAMLGLAALAGCSSGQAKGAAKTAQMAGADSAASIPDAAPETGPTGATIYQRCATCHQPNGKGMAGAFPPLAGSEWANAREPAVPIRIVLHGLSGPITVASQRFNSAMPPYGTNQPLNDSAVAAVLTYVRSSWGNSASAVTPAEVAAQRAATSTRTTPWTAQLLEPLLRAGSQ
jgi:mono/diheme cytochrome c family protein